MGISVRTTSREDNELTRRLVLAAFHDNEPAETAAFLDAMRAEGCVIGEWLSEDETGPIAHIVFSRVWIESEGGDLVAAAMLTPLAVRPDRQRKGIGTSLMAAALAELEKRGEKVFLVLGHPAYYPRVGFSAEDAKLIKSPWDNNPAFMARSRVSLSGTLILPQSIVEAH